MVLRDTIYSFSIITRPTVLRGGVEVEIPAEEKRNKKDPYSSRTSTVLQIQKQRG